MKYLFGHERGRVISEQVTPGVITAPKLDATINAPRPEMKSQPESPVDIGPNPKDQAQADAFRKWLYTAPQTGWTCTNKESYGQRLKYVEGKKQKFTGPCMKIAWAKLGPEFLKSGTAANTTTTTNQDYYVSQASPSLETAFNDVLKQIGGTGFTTFLYSKRGENYEAVASNLTVPQLVEKYGESFSQYPNAATTIGAPANNVFTSEYVTSIKTFEGKQTGQTDQTNQTDQKPTSPENVAAEIKTPEQAQKAIADAEKTAKELKAQTKVDKEVCRTVSKAINPIIPFKKGVTSPDLCNKLWQCMDQGFIIRGDQKFVDACPKPAQDQQQGNVAPGTQQGNAAASDDSTKIE